jgi:hypothetical protein
MWGNKNRIYNFGGEESCKGTVWKMKRNVRGNMEMNLNEVNVNYGGWI